MATTLEAKATLMNTSLGGWRAQAFQNCQEANLITLTGRAALSNILCCMIASRQIENLRSINRKHSRTECKSSLEMSISRGVFEGDINCDCICTRFFEAPEAGEPL